MNKTILILAIIAVLLIAYVAMKSEKTTIERTPVSDTVVVQTPQGVGLPTPDATQEVIIVDEDMPDPQDVVPVDEEIAPTSDETVSGETEVISVQ